ncbi:MAG: transposase [bacterium]|nr:transposase [bacterium]
MYEVAGLPVLVTICTRDRRATLTAGSMPEVVAGALRSASASVPMEVLVWCVMPDHLHVVVAPKDGSNIVEWVRRFKGRVTADARRQGLRNLWQRSFHDHVLRVEEAIAGVVSYVLANPVRAELVESWREWPHRGSLTWDLSEWVDL